MNLTKNAIAMITSSVDVVRPILQVNDVKLVNNTQSATERYRMVLSDGEHLQQAMLATQLSVIVKEGKLMKGSIVQLNEFICNIIQGRRIIIVISLDVLVPQLDPIGDPKNFDNSSGSPQNRSSMLISPSIPDHQLQIPQPYLKPHSTSPDSQQNMMTGISVNSRPTYNGTTNSLLGINMGSAVNDSYINGGAQNQRFSTISNASNISNPYGCPNQQVYQPSPPTYADSGPISKKLSADSSSSSVPSMAMPSMDFKPNNVKMEQVNQTGYMFTQQVCSSCLMSGHSAQNCPRGGMGRQVNNAYGGDFGNGGRGSNDGAWGGCML